MTVPLNVVVLAAGKGTRMYSALPKVLHRLAGRPLLQHVVDTARALTPSRIVVVYGHGGEMVPKSIPGCDIEWVLQAEQLGTGHALKQAIPHLVLEAPTLVLYGDVPLTSASTLTALVGNGEAASMRLLTVEIDEPFGYGRIIRDERGRVIGIVEQKDATGAQQTIREINTGIMVLPTARLGSWLGALGNNNAQREYYLTDIVGMAVAEGLEIATATPAGVWEILGVNSKSQLADLERTYQKRQAETLMGHGVGLADPARVDVRGNLRCGRDVFIDVNCVFEGDVVLGDDVFVGPNCVLRDVTVDAGTRIDAYSHLDGSHIGPDNRVGPFSRIRPGTVLQASVHVGNFVEIKNSTVDAGSKINHLSYVGDSTVGKRVNIGAGTITCNYDGANKHRTVIGDDVFVGSDTQLVAPVTIGDGATIGAGSTITRDTPPGELTLSRVKQVTVTGWQRPRKKSAGSN